MRIFGRAKKKGQSEIKSSSWTTKVIGGKLFLVNKADKTKRVPLEKTKNVEVERRTDKTKEQIEKEKFTRVLDIVEREELSTAKAKILLDKFELKRTQERVDEIKAITKKYKR